MAYACSRHEQGIVSPEDILHCLQHRGLAEPPGWALWGPAAVPLTRGVSQGWYNPTIPSPQCHLLCCWTCSKFPPLLFQPCGRCTQPSLLGRVRQLPTGAQPRTLGSPQVMGAAGSPHSSVTWLMSPKMVPQLPFPLSPPCVPASPGQERCEGQPLDTAVPHLCCSYQNPHNFLAATLGPVGPQWHSPCGAALTSPPAALYPQAVPA